MDAQELILIQSHQFDLFVLGYNLFPFSFVQLLIGQKLVFLELFCHISEAVGNNNLKKEE